jgi:hypothetical protein
LPPGLRGCRTTARRGPTCRAGYKPAKSPS